MIETIMIGHIGQNAKIVRTSTGEFVSFSVAHTDRFADRRTGQPIEDTMWVSVSMDGNGGNLLQYLTTGKIVCLRGRLRAKPDGKGGVYYNMNNPRIDLIGGKSQDNAQ